MQKLTKKIRLNWLITWTFLKRSKQSVLFIVVLVILTVLLQFKFNVLGFNTNSLSEGFIGTYQEHDIPLEVTRLLSSGLVEVDKSGHPTPKLVSGWDVNNDATIFKFYLKDNLYWTDNSKVKALDFDFAFPNVEITTPDDKTIQFKLSEPFSPFPSLLTGPIFKKGTLVGTGPYHIARLTKSRVFINRLVLQSDKFLPEVLIRFYPNEKTAQTGFELGEVQSVWGLNDGEIKDNQLVKTLRIDDFSKLVTILYSNKDPLLSNRSFRQALSYGAPKADGVMQAHGPFPPNYWATYADSKNYLSNPDNAKAALDRAKNSTNSDMVKKELVLTVTSQLESLGKKVVAGWRELGINAVLRVEPGIPQNFQALLITQSIPLDPDQYFLWHSTQDKTNITQYSSPRADKDLEDARKTSNEDDRKTKYADFQKVLLEDSPATFLYFPKYNISYLKKAENKVTQMLPLQAP